ncbi:MAG: hypothetical protein RLZZ115_2245 [Cyanobacteriota bacterium]
MTHPQIRNLERVAKVLAAVPERFVFTGGATICLYLDEILQDELRASHIRCRLRGRDFFEV